MEVSETVMINAPPLKVWLRLTDFESWAEWHPLLTARGQAREGERVFFSLKRFGAFGKVTSDRLVAQVSPPHRLLLSIYRGFGLRSTESFQLEEVDGGSRLTHSIRFLGPFSFIGWIAQKAMRNWTSHTLSSLAATFSRRIDKTAPSINRHQRRSQSRRR